MRVPPNDAALRIFQKVVEQTIVSVKRSKEIWVSENNLIHAGAAEKLVSILKEKLKENADAKSK